MKSKLKIRTIEDIALQFIKRTEPKNEKIKQKQNNMSNKICSSKTLIDYKFCIKKYSSKNTEKSLLQNYDCLVPIDNKENKENININGNKNISNKKIKIIKFYKIPQKDLTEEEECSFHSDLNNESSLEIMTQRTMKLFNKDENSLRKIKKIKYDTNLFFNLSYQNIYDSITEIYYPLMQNFESISSLKTMTNNTLSCIDFFSNHDSIFDLIPSKGDENIFLSDFFDQLKIYENIEISLILFITHIILETKIEYLDSFNEDDIIVIYHDCYSVIQKFYEIIILIILFNDNMNKINKTKENLDENKNIKNNNCISFESLCLKYVKDFFKFSKRPNINEDIINKINENIFIINKLLFNSCVILFGNLILFKKDSGNLECPDKEELIFLNKCNNINNINANISNPNEKNKIFLSKEFNDQYIIYKTMYLYFIEKLDSNNKKETSNEQKEQNPETPVDENHDNNSRIQSNDILKKLTSINSSLKEISSLFILYYQNFKILIEKNKVKPPFLPPLDSKKYKYSLILDLDETLVHYIEEENRAYVQVRPYADFFLNEMAKYFELVIFTAAAEDYADIVLNELDKNKVIKYKLYRKHTEQINGVFIKDLSKLGRDLSKILIVDNNKDNFSLQPENGLHICSFIGDQNDDELYNLSGDLMKIIDSDKNDIRPVIKEIKDIMKKRYQNKEVILE